MTEESSADEAESEPADGEHDRADEHEFAPARSDEEPDLEAAKEELEAVGRADDEDEQEEGEGDEDEYSGDEDGEDEDGEDEAGTVDADSEDPESVDVDEDPDAAEDAEDSEIAEGAEDSDTAEDTEDSDTAEDAEGSETAEADDEPNPEDLVRDPDEPQVTSSLAEAESEAAAEEAEAAEAETDATDEEPAEIDDEPATESEGDEEAAGENAEAAEEVADEPDSDESATDEQTHQPGVPDDVQKYDRFKKVDGSQYERVNEFLRDRTYITAREWAIARLCSDFRTETGVEMTKIGDNLPELVPFMTDTYTPQAVNQARASFEDKVRTAGATFLYGAMCDFFTAEELDDVMYEATEVAKFLLEVEGVELSVEDELEAEDRISAVMREVRSSSAELRHERCPDCGAELSGGD